MYRPTIGGHLDFRLCFVSPGCPDDVFGLSQGSPSRPSRGRFANCAPTSIPQRTRGHAQMQGPRRLSHGLRQRLLTSYTMSQHRQRLCHARRTVEKTSAAGHALTYESRGGPTSPAPCSGARGRAEAPAHRLSRAASDRALHRVPPPPHAAAWMPAGGPALHTAHAPTAARAPRPVASRPAGTAPQVALQVRTIGVGAPPRQRAIGSTNTRA